MASTNHPIAGDDVALTRSITPPNAQCDMCSKILKAFQTPYEKSYEADLGNILDLLASDCPHTEWLRDVKSSLGPVPSNDKGHLSADKEDFSRGLKMYLNNEGDIFDPDPFLDLELIYRPEVPDHRGTMRLMNHHWVKFDLIKEWIFICTRDHGDKCNKTVGDVEPISPRLLINVVQGCIVECKEESPRFISLSYTWGKSKNFKLVKSNIEQLQRKGALNSDYIIAQLPRTILDAIELTKALGETWLWVDSLCVVQDDDERLTYQLSTMHRIYATSFLTIVAADGKDAEYGLRGLAGISSRRDVNQNVLPLSRGESVASMGLSCVSQGPPGLNYHQRMWTAQEYDFSKRRLLFQDGQIKWDCNCALWTEVHLYDPELDKDRLTLGSGSGYIGRGTHLRLPSLSTLSRLIKVFNDKSLKFEEDVTSAFAGYNTYLNTIFPAGLVYGHPQIFFDVSLCWRSYSDLRRRKVSETYTGDTVHNGLPTWSWMGWQGAISFPSDAESGDGQPYDMGFTETITEWYIMRSPRSIQKRKIESRWSQYRKAPPDSMTDIWRYTEINPPSMALRSRIGLKSMYDPYKMPRELPKYLYTDILDDLDFPNRRWYPVPLNNTSPNNESEAESFKKDQYLWCQTSRAFLRPSTVWVIPVLDRLNVHLLEDGNGNKVGALSLHKKEDYRELLQESRVEVIAICKGWTVFPHSYSIKHTYDEESSIDTHLTQEEQNHEKEAQAEPQEMGPIMIPWMEKFDIVKEYKQNCYHVLWIEWENGVAYRKACGYVLESHWDRLAESGKVSVTLG
ncbi:hypothetical protein ACHAPA_000404 [Fusarium lateritium]